MTRKSFIIILITSIIVTYCLGIIDALTNSSASQAGLPFKFGSYALFGAANTNYLALILNVIFWFIIIWGIWKLIKRIQKK